MKFLVDESVDWPIARWLREQGHDVLAVVEQVPGFDDDSVLELAWRERRIVVTNDKGFGELVWLRQRPVVGMLLIRVATEFPEERLRHVVASWPRIADLLADHFVILTDRSIRVRPLPSL